MASRKLSDLYPSVQNMAFQFMDICREEYGIEVLIYCTYRSKEEQAVLYAQGRESLEEVNDKRQSIGLWKLRNESENRIVTNAKAGESIHNYHFAFDAVPLEAGKPVWDKKHPAWAIMGHVAKQCGLEWAGAWKRFKEYPHFQFTGGLTLAEMKAGNMPA